MTKEYRVDELLKMAQCNELLHPWQKVILKRNMYELSYNCHGSDLHCIGCGSKYGRGHRTECVLKEK